MLRFPHADTKAALADPALAARNQAIRRAVVVVCTVVRSHQALEYTLNKSYLQPSNGSSANCEHIVVGRR